LIDLKLFRRDNGIRQSELCELLGVKQSYISLMERGVRPVNKEKFEILRNHYGDIVNDYHEKYKLINKVSSDEKIIESNVNSLSDNEKAILLQLLAEKDRVIDLLNEKYNGLAEKYDTMLVKIGQLEQKLNNTIADKMIIKKIDSRGLDKDSQN